MNCPECGRYVSEQYIPIWEDQLCEECYAEYVVREEYEEDRGAFYEKMKGKAYRFEVVGADDLYYDTDEEQAGAVQDGEALTIFYDKHGACVVRLYHDDYSWGELYIEDPLTASNWL